MNTAIYERSRHRNRSHERLRTIIFAAPPAAIPDQIKEIIEFEFPWAMVAEVDNIQEINKTFSHTVSLILVHEDLLDALEASADALYRYHPLSLTAVIDCGDTLQHLSRQILASKLIGGVLPIYTRVEVWLSVLALLMRGVSFFPREILAAFEQSTPPDLLAPPIVPGLARNDLPKPLLDLTQREMEVLELVERGFPNKSIANSLNISANTVKIHLHNIISKLGAQNRTGAAALLHNARTGSEQSSTSSEGSQAGD